MSDAVEHVDVLIVGAGLSGIGAASRLRRAFPQRRCLILEARADIGGTWDLFRYPGVRSDSDMFTLGYRFRPWAGDRSIADGASILTYLRDTVSEEGIGEQIRFGHRVVAAEWSSTTRRWTVSAQRTDTGETVVLTASFLFCCSGYYRYDRGYTPKFPGQQRFSGSVVHPQHWPHDMDVAGKRVVIVGSGATAMTLGPALAGLGARVSMVQRSPSYLLSVPARDRWVAWLPRILPRRAAHRVLRAKSIAVDTAIYQLSRRYPERARAWLRARLTSALPHGYDIDTHFTPRYDPWDQRMCLVPDGDLFEAIRTGALEMITDRIDTLTESGVRLTSGAEVPADIIVTATGLELQVFGGITLSVDGEPVDVPRRLAYKAMMLSGVPNFAFTIGYVNASWTLKADLVCDYVVRLLRHLDRRAYTSVTPVHDPDAVRAPFVPDFTPGYFRRGGAHFPSRGDRAPWRLRMNYLRDLPTFRHHRLEDGILQFTRAEHRFAEDSEPEASQVVTG
ncbi:flavin-containing monooxygenase [Nocardia sp. NPDC059246]|uniref:flavin-containing monooxygenase n=1 Tax=unclassified Nocardia TaxID=2637762 RepID=UPI0036BD8E05